MQTATTGQRRKLDRVASIVFGGYVALTSAVLIAEGVQAWGGWLSILYGLLGIATGLAGIAAPLSTAHFAARCSVGFSSASRSEPSSTAPSG